MTSSFSIISVYSGMHPEETMENFIQETSLKKIIVEGEYMWKNWFWVRTQNNWVQVWNNLNGGNW